MAEDAKIANLFDALRVGLLSHLLPSVQEAAALKDLAVAVRAAKSDREAALIIRDALVAPLLAKRMESDALRRLSMETLIGPWPAASAIAPQNYTHDNLSGA